MADFRTLIASIEATIKQNGVQAITGQIMQDEMLLMVSAINQLKQDTLEGYAFYGESLPNGATRVVTQNTFFLAGVGSYTINGNSVTIADNGISVIVYDCVNDEITTYLLFAYDANPTSGSANAVTSGGVKSALDTKADKDGASPNLFAGFAGNLVDTRSAGTRQGPFAFRQSGGDGVNYMRKILGRTILRNQSCDNGEAARNRNTSNYGSFTCAVENGHKYLVSFISNLTAAATGQTWRLFVNTQAHNFGSLTTGRQLVSTTLTATVNATSMSLYANYVSQADENDGSVEDVMIVDLTLLGLGDLTTAQFQALFPLPYYAYNAGVLKNNAATGLESVGFNQWDEEVIAYGPTSIQSANYIPVFPSTAYYFNIPSGLKYDVLFYDANKVQIGSTDTGNTAGVKTTRAGSAYIKFRINLTTPYGGTTYNHDICINRSDASRNGTYEPYWKREIVLGLDNLACHDEQDNAVVVNGLDGVGTAQDELFVENGWGTKIIKRRGRRAYQAGDESDATLMTDGTNTDYPLATPKMLTLDNPIPALIEVDNLGTEKRLPEDTADNPQAPFECDSNYSISTANLVRKLSE